MFDYQAGEKYKVTLVMTALAGLFVGVFFTLMLMPQPEPAYRGRGGPHNARVASRQSVESDSKNYPQSSYIEGMRDYNKKMQAGTDADESDINQIGPAGQAASAAYAQTGSAAESQPAVNPTLAEAAGACDVNTAVTLLERWLPLSWDLSANSAKFSQEKAISYMTNQCANQYRKHIWTKNISDQIEATGIVSHFKLINLTPEGQSPDGSVTINVQAEQELDIPGKGSKARELNVKYLVIQTNKGPRIASITEG